MPRLGSPLLVAGSVIAILACGNTNQAPAAGASSAAPPVDTKPIAAQLVTAAMIKPGDKVWVTGSVRDAGLMEDVGIETMKAGGRPLMAISSDQFTRRSYTDVPATYDAQPQTLELGLVGLMDAAISIDVGESDSVTAGVPAARIAARAQQGVPVNQLFLKRAIRSVSLGNGIYPTATLATRLGIPLAQLSDVFWKAAAVPPDTIRAKGEALRAALSAAKQVTLTSANGTNITFAVAAAKGSVSDGALTPEKVKMGGAASQTWVPAGEFLVPVVAGSAEGKVVVDKSIIQGTVVTGLTLTYSKGVLTSMTATSGLDPLKAEYDAAKSGKDAFSFIDVGLNPAVQLPTNTGRIVWMAAGGVTVGMGDNTGWGGSNVSDFTYVGAVTAPTLTADGKALIDNGKPK